MTASGILPIPERGESPLLALPPLGFIPAEGVYYVIRRKERPGTQSRRRATSAQAAGLRYERAVQRYLCDELRNYEPSPWFEYHDARGFHYCQPDGVLINGNEAIIFEIKYRWCVEGWWQLARKYAPVVAAWRGSDDSPRAGGTSTGFGRADARDSARSRITLVCITRTFDPFVCTPTCPRRVDDLERATAPRTVGQEAEEVRVLTWRPLRGKGR